MLGVNHSVRNTPVSRRTTKLHRAISPSMNDQWSGKTLRRFFFAAPARPSRSSAQVAAAPTFEGLPAFAACLPFELAMSDIVRSPTFPEARADWLGEIAGCDQV